MAQNSTATITAFRKACDDLADAVNEQLFDGARDYYWIGGKEGGACDFDDCDIINSDDMVRILEHGMTYEHYSEWRDANLDQTQYINLSSWLKGLRHDMINSKPREQFASRIGKTSRQEIFKSLWHDAHEEPKEGYILCQHSDDYNVGTPMYSVRNWTLEKSIMSRCYSLEEFASYRNSYWAIKTAHAEIIRWCYVNDLLPEKGENEG